MLLIRGRCGRKRALTRRHGHVILALRADPELILPYLDQAVKEAINNLSWGEAAGSTTLCERVRVFGSQRMVQMASTVNAMILFIPPLSAAVLLLAFLLSLMLYMIII